MMVRPRPNMKPTWTACGMKRATNLSRARPMTRRAIPASTARAAARIPNRSTLAAATATTMDAEMAAVENVGLTMTCFEVPNSPYPTRPAAAANRPVHSGSPAIWA